MTDRLGFEVLPFAMARQFDGEAYEGESGTGRGALLPRRAAAVRYVTDFSGPAAECVVSLRRAGKTKAQALAIINAQIGLAIAMLSKAAAALKHGARTQSTKDLFLKIFRVRPEYMPDWLKPTESIKDRGDVVATRCARVADLLASGKLKFFCTINTTNCPDCENVSQTGTRACTSYSRRVICLGDLFWNKMKAGKTGSVLATLMHEPFHIYYGVYVTEHHSNAGKFGNINCIVKFVFDLNNRRFWDDIDIPCGTIKPRHELETPWSFA